MRRAATSNAPQVRCAIYTRKSSEEGLQQEFNSLDAQREAAEAYIASQKHDGWVCLPDHYDDGGYTGGNMDRPALRRLMADIEAGKVDAVVVYKVDRLSRSLMDFARMMQTFDERKIAFVSVTQQFNTGTSMGRLVLNVLLSFAQFEREMVSERTRDKIAATRRKGKWTGGLPPLGYDVDRDRNRLVINDGEARRVRTIFNLYLEHQSLLPVVKELDQRGWLNKQWQIKKTGGEKGGNPFDRTSLHRLLSNPIYIAKVKYKDEIHVGEHQAIIDPEIWQRTQAMLRRNGRSGGAQVRNQFGALLKGIIYCSACNCAMTPAHSKKGQTRYRYYTCTNAQKRGWDNCPSRSVPAAQIEQVVIDQIKCVGRDPAVLREVLAEANRQNDTRLAELDAEQRELERDLKNWHADLRRVSGEPTRNGATTARLADLQERIGQTERRIAAVGDEVAIIRNQALDPDDVAAALAWFTPVWDALTPQEQARVVGLLVARVDFDGSKGKLKIGFHATGIQTLMDEMEDGTFEEQVA
jgi:site-specific DNA recombinase